MKILFCSGEAYPFSKSGGLADVAASLPKALVKLGHEVTIITPFYQQIKEHIEKMTYLGERSIKMGIYEKKASYYQLKHDEVFYVFVDNDDLFNRQRYYGYEDDAMRFTFFNFAIFEYMLLTSRYVDIIHANDWQTGLIPFFLDVKYRQINPSFQAMKTLLSIHNLEKQGSYPIETEKLFNTKNFTYIHMDRVNFLKCGIMRANGINTVSENYRNEILTRFYGFTLDGPLKARQSDLYGILNGLDPDLYDPMQSDIMRPYGENDFTQGKFENKSKLIQELKLDQDINKPLVSFIHRFARQKGIDLLMPVLEEYLEIGAFNFIVLGYGDALYEQFFHEMQKKYPNHVYYENGFNSELSKKVYAASDLFMLPSLFEPCGLNQMIAMRYGALPIVRETGGLKDTVTPYNKFTGIGVGFAFKNYDADELKETIDEALTLYHEDKEAWTNLIHQAMHVNYSLSKMARKYVELYTKILEQK
ncbi:MAG: glycogen/starch synthase [Acholeplasmataceae bacterium]|jgi:starch synthase|nr:glycogen/starch synthase [Acholeplasmataceae bacterium]